MSDLSVTLYLNEPVQGHAQLQQAWQQHLKPHLLAGRRLALTVAEAEDERSIQQHRYYWGVVLQEVSEQVVVGGQKYTKDAWHEYGKRQFLARRTKKVKVAGRKRPVVTTVIASTTDLSVRQFGMYLEQWMAFAAEHRVEISEPLPPHLRPQRKRQQAIERGEVDRETGEILEEVAA